MNKDDIKTALQSFIMCASDAINTGICFVMGVAGTGASGPAIIIAALVGGAFGGALSMSSGEYLEVDAVPDRGSPWSAAIIGFFSSITCAVVPVTSLFWLSGTTALQVSVLLSAITLFAVGAISSRFSRHSVCFMGIRQMVIGLIIAAVTYGLTYWASHHFGVRIGG
jgi:VIT1/CCC1 family predicted Fe2+/Mn2+ transporter